MLTQLTFSSSCTFEVIMVFVDILNIYDKKKLGRLSLTIMKTVMLEIVTLSFRA